MSVHQLANGSGRTILLPTLTITTALGLTAGTVIIGAAPVSYLVVQAKLVYGSGGTTVDVYIQTSLDLGLNWIDIMNFNFTTASATKVSTVVATTALAAVTAPTDGTLTANTIVSGLLGDRFRVKYKSTGTYAGGTTITVDSVFKDV